VRKDKTAAMMFDFNLMGKGYRFSDFRNICWVMSAEAKAAFIQTYHSLYEEKYNTCRAEAERAEERFDEVAGPLFSLYFAFEKYENLPDWAKEAKEAVLSEGLLAKTKALLDPEGQDPYAITFIYGEDGRGTDVELRFNWITDRAAPTVITCEGREAFEANGFSFSPNAHKAYGTCTLVENTTQFVNDAVKLHFNLAAYHSHKAEITLQADRYYYYSVGASPPVLIKTRTENPSSFSFLWLADPQQDKYSRGTLFASWDGTVSPLESGNYQENVEKAVIHAYAPEQASLYINGKPDFALCTGDHVEHGYDKDGFDGFFLAAKKMLEATAYAPALGNHDIMGAPGHTGSWDSPDPFATMFKGRFNPPENGAAHTGRENGGPAAGGPAAEVLMGANYFFTYGNALIMVLQGNPWHTADYALDEQIQWMRYVVNKHGENRWKIVALHQGFYMVSYKPIHGYQKLMPAFDELGIDLVLNGHNHVYTRSKPIKNYQPVEKGEGTVYITGGTISGNCAWGGYIYKPDRTVPEENGLAIKDAVNFLSLTDLVDENNMNIYHVITIDEKGITITAKRAFDGTTLKHNDTRPGDVKEEYKTLITSDRPLTVGNKKRAVL
jgi:hypothetical protein